MPVLSTYPNRVLSKFVGLDSSNRVGLSTALGTGTWFDVKAYGAVGDGSTNDTTAIQNAVNAAGNGIIYFPPGGYLVSAAIHCTSSVVLMGAGRDASSIFCGSNDCTVIDLDGRNSTIRDLSISGSENFGATNPALILRTDCDNCLIENNYFDGGRYCILNLGTDNTFFQNEMRYAYGSALMKCAQGSGNFIIRNKMDQVWPFAQPADGYTINSWAGTTAYTTGAVVETGGFRIQCVVAGTSGGIAPTLLVYETNIVDGAGTLRWQLVAPITYYSFQMDTGASENFMDMNDHSGAFANGIGITDTGDDGGSGKPFYLWINNAIMGQHSDSGLRCLSGYLCSISNSEVSVGWASGTGITTESDWDGNLQIIGNKFNGSASGTGVKLYGSYNGTTVSQNIFSGSYVHAINVDTGFGAIGDLMITANTVLSGFNISIDSNVDWYIVTNNNTHGGGVSDSGAGSNKTVSGNI